ncbi:MAG: tetratricopeptide repeat protein [Spirochaetaceae bacterium]|jgi:Flp pilus assembly protein TadD|nr:tetratricopeptide repeat protein [Spirochaetaceae bacterium]
MSACDEVCTQAQNAVRAGNFAEAEELLTKYLDKVPDEREVRFLRGTIRAKLDKLPEAEEDFIALTVAAQNIAALNNLAVIYGRRDKLQDALGTLLDTIEVAPTETELYYNVGTVYERLGYFKAASMAYAKVAELDAGYVPAYNRLGISQFKLGLLPKALETFTRTLEVHPAQPAVLNNMGVLLANQGRTGEAIQNFRQALAADSQYAKAAANLELAAKLPDNTETVFLWDEEPDFLFIENLPAGSEAKETPGAVLSEEAPPKKELSISSKTALALVLYLKNMTEALPPKAKEYFLLSDARLSMEYLIAVLEGHSGLLKEIREWELAPESGKKPVSKAVSGGKTLDLPGTLDYLRKMAGALADPDLSATLRRKMDTVILDLDETTGGRQPTEDLNPALG